MEYSWEELRDNSVFQILAGVSISAFLSISIGCSTRSMDRYRDYSSILENGKEEREVSKDREEKIQAEDVPEFPKPGVTYSEEETEVMAEKLYDREEEELDVDFLERDDDEEDFFDIDDRYHQGVRDRDNYYDRAMKDPIRREDPRDRDEVDDAIKETGKYLVRKAARESRDLEVILNEAEDLANDINSIYDDYTTYKIPENRGKNQKKNKKKSKRALPNIRRSSIFDIIAKPFRGGKISFSPENDRLNFEGAEIEFKNEIEGWDLKAAVKYEDGDKTGLLKLETDF